MAFVRLFKDRNGGVAPLLALCLIPLVLAVGAAVDYSRAGSVRTAMQAAGNATALMLAKNALPLLHYSRGAGRMRPIRIASTGLW